ncbi:helix-turn-helix domain-containing protein [Marinobacter sp. CHS3-4]|uniref:helix-turn-helix domain-containing protein n=1 Tax=Marinobacter sp. CHS3-4 TaxID=3045174 RepID=UPI0024B4FD31|nr:helix-turn-helix domain-containing protein [Marinobacter sp. CHS3-4]MDI9245288.1 helix-turn-helix domain-containing protein [Marinobacter sp. CHS3-4]
MLIRAFLNSSDAGTSAATGKAPFEEFARKKGHRVGVYYNEQRPAEHRSGLFRLLRDKGLAIATQGRSTRKATNYSKQELHRLLREARPGDVLLVNQAHSLPNLLEDDWDHFRQKIRERKLRLVSLDVESSWAMVTGDSGMAMVAEQLTGVMLDMLEISSSQGYQTHRRRQLQGIARAKEQGKYKGRPVDHHKHERIMELLQDGKSWSEICRETGVSRSTIARVVKSGG